MGVNRFALDRRIQRYIEDRSEKVTESGCWVWMMSLTARGGYGQVSYGSFGTEKAHRLSYTAFNGPIPHGMFVCHRCDNPACVNPSHLFVGTSMENCRDMISKHRGNRRREAIKSRKLTAEQVIEIRNSTGSQVKVGERFGVSSGVIGSVRRRVSYREVA